MLTELEDDRDTEATADALTELLGERVGIAGADALTELLGERVGIADADALTELLGERDEDNVADALTEPVNDNRIELVAHSDLRAVGVALAKGVELPKAVCEASWVLTALATGGADSDCDSEGDDVVLDEREERADALDDRNGDDEALSLPDAENEAVTEAL